MATTVEPSGQTCSDNQTCSDKPSGSTTRAWHWLWQVAMFTFIGAVVVLLMVMLVVPRLGGATPYTILTGSMRPSMPPGTLVVAKPIDPKKVGVGTVITYQLVSGQPQVVTHRVTQVHVDARGRYTFTTQGDANNVADAKRVLPVQVRGERWYSIPYLGYVNTWFGNSSKGLISTVVVAGLLGYATVMFLGAIRDRRKRGAS